MTLDGTNLETGLHLHVTKVEGAYDMPNRISPFMYDWGDEIQPIFSASQIGYEARKIKVEFLYDNRNDGSVVGNNANPIDYMNSTLKDDNTDRVLALTESSGSAGVYDVVISKFSDHKRYRRNKTGKTAWEFYERVPSFPGVLPSLPGSAPRYGLGGYNLSQFGIVIHKLKGLANSGELGQSSETVYFESLKKSSKMGLHEVSAICYMVGSSAQDVLIKMCNFQKLLISPNLLEFRFDDYIFDVFIARGFKAEKVRKNALKFELKMYRL